MKFVRYLHRSGDARSERRWGTLEAGDVIITGTPSGVSAIHPGDEVEIEIEGIGVLRNPVVADSTN